MDKLSKNFKRKEFQCKCGCGFSEVSQTLVDLLQELRDFIGKGVLIHSGCRCPSHNAKVGGGPSSAHTTGEAADIYVPGWDSETLGSRIKLLRHAGHLRDLTYCYKPGKNTVHVGVDKKPRSRIFGW